MHDMRIFSRLYSKFPKKLKKFMLMILLTYLYSFRNNVSIGLQLEKVYQLKSVNVIF